MYLVVFRNRKRSDIDEAAYAEAAQRMEDLAQVQPGFLSFKSFTADDGEVVAISEWTQCYAEYVLLAGEVTRHHRFPG